jgi:small GTP-binding protein
MTPIGGLTVAVSKVICRSLSGMTDDVGPKHKVVFVGDAQVGKTSLIHSYLNQDIDTVATLGATSTRVEPSVDDTTVLLNVWDTAGQESLRNLVPVYAKGSHAAVIVFDLTNSVSYEHVAGWYEYIVQTVGEIIICLAANKSDLPPTVDINEVFQWAADHHVQVTRTSAKDRVNVEALFETVARELIKSAKPAKGQQEKPPESPSVELGETPQKSETKPAKSGGCC